MTPCNVIYHTQQVEISHFTKSMACSIRQRMDANETFRKNLKALRLEKGFNARQLSERAGLGERNVKDIEEGRSQSPKISTVFSLAKALDADPAEMMGLGTRVKINSDLAEFLEQFDAEGQSRLLAALAAIPRKPG
ncbi:helix-turn-helix domain-containing protein [Loktanella sp. R86503]|uniref:helix-turn-helix domain-containing protein n=1 Tax=Loktanella sp. R86503 TaxID=3093847 RepID=UPI0036DC68EA